MRATIKKTALSIITIALTCVSAFATTPTPSEVIAKYNKVTNLINIDPSEAMKMDMAINANGQNIKIQAIILGTKINCDMTVMGQKMKLVSDGTKGWMTVPGQGVVELPTEQVVAQAKQMNPLAGLNFNDENYDMTLKTDNTHYIIEAINKKGSDKNPQTIYINKVTNYIDKIHLTVEGLNTITELADYKKFDNVKMPSKITTYIDSKKMVEINITELETNYPAPLFLFNKPE